ncbi:MAG: DUF805 domain-containing protein [Paracoccaceae bacterium]
MGPVEAIKTCLLKYVTFSGRAARPEYWWFVLFAFLGSAVLSLVDGALFGPPEPGEGAARPLSGLFQLAVFLPSLAAGWRRMHDTGRKGWLILLPLLVALVVDVVLVGGVVGFSLAERAGAPEDELRAAAGVLGGFGLLVGAVLQLGVLVLMIWWLSRPSEPGANAYGPPPG